MTEDAFINPELELQMYQSNLETGPSYDAVQLEKSIDRVGGLLDTIKDDTDAIVSLEAMAEFIKNRSIDKTSAILFNVATESYGNLSSLNAPRVAFALEGMTQEDAKLAPEEIQAAMENLTQNAADLANRLAKSISEAMVAIGDIVHGFDRNLLSLKKRIAKLETLVDTIKDKQDVAYSYVKPEPSYTYLMYTNDGFSNGIKPVVQDINWLLSEHSDMVGDSVGKYKDWLSQHKADIDNPKVLDSLEFNKDDFLLSGSSAFNRSVGNKIPSKGCAFYRTKEIPGGKCFYSEVRIEKQHGSDVVDALMDVNYFIDYFEPDSFRVMEKRVYHAASLTLLTWASIMLANPLPLALHGVAASHIADSTKIADVKKVRISPETLFPTLTHDELQQMLTDLKKAILSLENWNRVVYVQTWKDKTIQEMVDSLVKEYKETGSLPAGAKQIKRLAVALISLMGKSYTKIHAHSFHVLNAALNYAEKSAKQYR